MDSEKQALAPAGAATAPAFPEGGNDDTFYPPMENPPPYSPPYPDPSKFQQQHQHNMQVPQQQPAYSSVQQVPLHPHQTIVQIVNPPLPQFGQRSALITCPYCAASIHTRVTKRYTGATHFMAGLLCFMCLCCFAWVPYAAECFNNYEHSCPNCDKFLGMYSNPNQRRYRY